MMQITFEFVELGLWMITLILMLIIDVYCFHVWRKDESSYYRALFCLFFLLILAFLCSLSNIYFFGFDYTSLTSSYLLFNPTWLLLRSLFIIFAISGMVIFHYEINKEVLNTKGVFIFLQFIIMILVLLNYLIPLELILILFLGALTFLSLPAIYLYIAIKSPGDLRTNSFLIAVGSFGLLMGLLLSLPEVWILYNFLINTFSINIPPDFHALISFSIGFFPPILIPNGIGLCMIGVQRSRRE